MDWVMSSVMPQRNSDAGRTSEESDDGGVMATSMTASAQPTLPTLEQLNSIMTKYNRDFQLGQVRPRALVRTPHSL